MERRFDVVLFQSTLIGPAIFNPATIGPHKNHWRTAKRGSVLPPEQVEARRKKDQERGLKVLGKYLLQFVKNKKRT